MKKLQNITLSAPKDLISKARTKAKRHRFSLNGLFQDWLRRYVGTNSITYSNYIKQFGSVLPGKKFTRAEMNER